MELLAEKIVEVHPEVSLWALADVQLEEPKRSWNGLSQRRRLLADAGIERQTASSTSDVGRAADPANMNQSVFRGCKGLVVAFMAAAYTLGVGVIALLWTVGWTFVALEMLT